VGKFVNFVLKKTTTRILKGDLKAVKSGCLKIKKDQNPTPKLVSIST
jgi:hypothetical protein